MRKGHGYLETGLLPSPEKAFLVFVHWWEIKASSSLTQESGGWTWSSCPASHLSTSKQREIPKTFCGTSTMSISRNYYICLQIKSFLSKAKEKWLVIWNNCCSHCHVRPQDSHWQHLTQPVNYMCEEKSLSSICSCTLQTFTELTLPATPLHGTGSLTFPSLHQRVGGSFISWSRIVKEARLWKGLQWGCTGMTGTSGICMLQELPMHD